MMNMNVFDQLTCKHTTEVFEQNMIIKRCIHCGRRRYLYYKTFVDSVLNMEFVYIHGGRYYANKGYVDVPSFWMSKYAVTYSAEQFLTQLITITDKFTDKRHRLLTENEWKYVEHAGYEYVNDVLWYNEMQSQAWLLDNSLEYITSCKDPDVGTLFPNIFGIYDVFGYMWELCYWLAIGGNKCTLNHANTLKCVLDGTIIDGNTNDYKLHIALSI